MMKNMIRIVALALVLAMSVVALAACGGKEASIKSAFEKEGYTVKTVKNEDLDAVTKGILNAFIDEIGEESLKKYEIILCNKGFSTAIILKFPSDNDLKAALTFDGDSEIYDESVEEGVINGNCLLIPVDPTVINIFKNA